MNFLQLCQTTRQECGVQGGGPALTTNQTGVLKKIVDWVSAACLFVETEHLDWDFLWAEFTANSVVGSAYFTKPSDHGLWDTESIGVSRGTADGRQLSVVDYRDWRKNFSAKENEQPTSITVLPNNNLALNVPADDTFQVYGCYWKAGTVLAADTDVPLIPARFHRIIIAKAKMWFYEDIESTGQWEQAREEYTFWLEQLEYASLPEHKKLGLNSPAPIIVRPE